MPSAPRRAGRSDARHGEACAERGGSARRSGGDAHYPSGNSGVKRARSAACGKSLAPAVLDRLILDTKRIEAIAQGLGAIAALPDPVGPVIAAWDRPNDFHIERVRVPLGVIGIIYEVRANVIADAGGLCFKAGAAILAALRASIPRRPRRLPP